MPPWQSCSLRNLRDKLLLCIYVQRMEVTVHLILLPPGKLTITKSSAFCRAAVAKGAVLEHRNLKYAAADEVGAIECCCCWTRRAVLRCCYKCGARGCTAVVEYLLPVAERGRCTGRRNSGDIRLKTRSFMNLSTIYLSPFDESAAKPLIKTRPKELLFSLLIFNIDSNLKFYF